MFVFKYDSAKRQHHLDSLVAALKRASLRGVTIYIVLEMPSSEGDKLADTHATIAHELRAHGIDARLDLPTTSLHSKLVVVDHMHVFVGSHNWSEGALSGREVLESSILVSLSVPNPHLEHLVRSTKVISDMRSPRHTADEIALIRHLAQLSPLQRDSFIARLRSEGRVAPDAAQEPIHVSSSRAAEFPTPPLMAPRVLPRQSLVAIKRSDPQHGRAILLPAEHFGREALRLVQSATNRIWISAYYLTPANAEPMASIFEGLVRKAEGGVDVRILCEFGSRTLSSIRSQTLNTVRGYDNSKINVRFFQSGSVMHKKLLLVDGRAMIVGSSNLTRSGSEANEEMNALVLTPGIIRDAEADYQRLFGGAKSYSEIVVK
jgi:phosphatidylserine/phosphatidylglycerophosphate/cardiolipin synthase-like enzyme